MTKTVRIENADTSAYKVKVDVQELLEGEWKTIRTVDLDHPTFLAQESIFSTRRLIVREEH